MKLKGKKIPAPKPSVIIIPREDGDLIFHARPVIDFKEFEKVCPDPLPPRIIKPGGEEYFDPADPQYVENVKKHNDLQFAWVIIQSILATDGFEWETVKLNDPSTWPLWKDELEQSGLSQAEVSHLIRQIVECNTLSEDKIKEARDRFTLAQQTR